MLDRVLIANRGEIACRIIRSCRKLGIETVAVYSDADALALHVRLADHAVRLGEAPAAASYLNQERIVAAAQASGAVAVHPGYGFLAENARFAERCAEAGLVFVGPPPFAIRAMGAKDEAKRLMAEAGVPCVPGYHGADMAGDVLADEAHRIGFPLLVKAAAGGGGKGMRVVRAPDELADALAAARGEAMRAFGDDRVLLERYLERPRHIEAQILADAHGRAVYLFERECTLQRRHQKVVEEAPSPTLSARDRADLGDVALRAAAAIGYVNAGTVEFLWADGKPYFIEMNTRLQVEHPVTEMITGLDLVAWQLKIAAGERLDIDQSSLRIDGHAVEARLYAEDPAAGFLPSTGRLHVVRWPAPSPALRIETGVVEGDLVGLDYDPMLAKVVAHGPDRRTALARLDAALRATRILGLATNRGYLRRLATDEAVALNRIDTTWLERLDAAPETDLHDDAVRLAVADRLAERGERAAAFAARAGDPHSPWQAIDGFRLGAPAVQTVRLDDGRRHRDVQVVRTRDGWHLDWEGRHERLVIVHTSDRSYTIEVDGRRIEGIVVRDGDERRVALAAGDVRLQRVAAVASGADEATADGPVRAPMPGRVVEVAVGTGERVEAGQLLLKLEAMKMEQRVLAEIGGCVVELNVAPGDQVSAGATLAVIGAEVEQSP